jgi:hypothetical protein
MEAGSRVPVVPSPLSGPATSRSRRQVIRSSLFLKKPSVARLLRDDGVEAGPTVVEAEVQLVERETVGNDPVGSSLRSAVQARRFLPCVSSRRNAVKLWRP